MEKMNLSEAGRKELTSMQRSRTMAEVEAGRG
jgi:hypothetical protein